MNARANALIISITSNPHRPDPPMGFFAYARAFVGPGNVTQGRIKESFFWHAVEKHSSPEDGEIDENIVRQIMITTCYYNLYYRVKILTPKHFPEPSALAKMQRIKLFYLPQITSKIRRQFFFYNPSKKRHTGCYTKKPQSTNE